jgi:DNA-binding CsgD family transcriptional regulator
VRLSAFRERQSDLTPSAIQLFDWMDDILFCSDLSVATSSFSQLLEQNGFQAFACIELDRRHPDRSLIVTSSKVLDWDELWGADGFTGNEPIFKAVFAKRAAFTWSDLQTDTRVAREQRLMLRCSVARGWTEALVVPLPRSPDRWGVACVKGNRAPLRPNERSLLTIASALFFERAVAITQPRWAFKRLSSRELDCLRCVAAGLSDRGIAETLRIAESTAHEHIERAKRRLGAKTRAQAVALAFSSEDWSNDPPFRGM